MAVIFETYVLCKEEAACFKIINYTKREKFSLYVGHCCLGRIVEQRGVSYNMKSVCPFSQLSRNNGMGQENPRGKRIRLEATALL